LAFTTVRGVSLIALAALMGCAGTATRAAVGTLVMTHPVPPPPPGTEAEWLAEAAEGFDGSIVLAHDLWQHEL
jgi:ribonuclease Z